jgi:carbamoyltransferase
MINMVILGINTYRSDSSVAIVKDGELLTTIKEEGIRRIKHRAGFASEPRRVEKVPWTCPF